MAGGFPAVTGKQLIRLLEDDGWEARGRTTHGIALSKRGDDGHFRTTIIPDKRDSLPSGLVNNILGPKQTGIGRETFLALIAKYGLH